MLAGAYQGPQTPRPIRAAEPLVVFAGRHIPEKRVPAIVPAIARARTSLPELRALILGDGPERELVQREVARARPGGRHRGSRVRGHGGASRTRSPARCACCCRPSREGYGLVVVEAAASGTPSIVVAGPDNAAVELVTDGRNGYVAPSADPEALAEAILRVHEGGPALRRSTEAWFEANVERLSLEHSLQIVLGVYAIRERSVRS